jgi:type II secretory pathway pseudopilin PulG
VVHRPGAPRFLFDQERGGTVRKRNEAGETLVELCIALVIMGAIVAAYFAAYTTAASSSAAARNLVTADAVLRDYAEAAKTAVRASCASSNASQPANSFTVAFSAPAGFVTGSTPSLTGAACPAVATTLPVTLAVTLPDGHTQKTLDIELRTP